MMVSASMYLMTLLFSPLNILAGYPPGVIPSIPLIIVDTVIAVPSIYLFVRYWLRTMLRRKSGPAAGIDVVEPGPAEAEEGDEVGTATRPYSEFRHSKVAGTKSDIRESPLLEPEFFVRTPDLDSGQPIFDPKDLMARASIRSRVSSGGWIRKRVASRGTGSLKASESTQHGRPVRSREPDAEVQSIDIVATVLAAVTRQGAERSGLPIRIKAEDIREKVFAARTPLTVILVIDVSLSMRGYARDIRKIVERIERETRGSRDRVGIIAFKDSGAIEVQAPTSNWNKIYRALARLRMSGLTPLADGVMKALETIRRERMRDSSIEPLIVVISDFSPNIPLAQTAKPGSAKYTPVRDLVLAARTARRHKVRLVAVNLRADQQNWVRLLKHPYHEALELAATLRMNKDGYHSVVETILAVPSFRESFGAFLLAHLSGGRAFLLREVLDEPSVLGLFIAACQSRSRLEAEALESPEAYLR